MAVGQSSAKLHSLTNADGSATYISPNGGCTIIAGVNYPLEVPYRSDEIPESTYIEINVRPHNGVGMVKERHIEEIIRKTLKATILTEETPRTMLQVTLQITDVETDDSLPGGVKDGGQGESYLSMLTGCINAAVLGCLDAGVQMSGLVGAALVAIRRDGTIKLWPSVKERKYCQSSHIFGFNSHEHCILIESEGLFGFDQWQYAQSLARKAVTGIRTNLNGEDVEMDDNKASISCFEMMRRSVEARVARDEKWRQ